MNEWYALIQQFAIQRIDEIERHLLAHPEEYPQYAEATRMLHTAMDEHNNDGLSAHRQHLSGAFLGGCDQAWLERFSLHL